MSPMYASSRKVRRSPRAAREHIGAGAVRQYGDDADQDPERLMSSVFHGPQTARGLLRDLHGLYLLATECDIASTLIAQAAQAARDAQLAEIANDSAT